jgi:hypothetical protein
MPAGLQVEGHAAYNPQTFSVEGIGLVKNTQRSQPFVDTPLLENLLCVLCADVV